MNWLISSFGLVTCCFRCQHNEGTFESQCYVYVWRSNDYLGMGQHPKVIGAIVETATRMGTGAGGTRNIAGNNHPDGRVERDLTDQGGIQ
jgi:7-keto-8-aminopelargonate synthetase-like enzyme